MDITQHQLDRTALVLLVGDDGITEWSSTLSRPQITAMLRRIANAIEAEYSPALKEVPMLVRSFPGTPEQVSRARSEVRAFLNGIPGTDDTVMIVSELAANAVQHSLSRAGEFVVNVQVHHSYIYVEVTDEGGPWFSPDLDAVPDVRPHGLEIVTRLSRDWGADPLNDGRRAVWARVPITGPLVKTAGPLVVPPRPEAGSPLAPPPGVPLSSSAFSPPVYLEER